MHTPAFDALAKKSLVLFKNYVQQAVCVQIAIDLLPAVVHHCFVFVFVWFVLAFTEQLPPEQRQPSMLLQSGSRHSCFLVFDVNAARLQRRPLLQCRPPPPWVIVLPLRQRLLCNLRQSAHMR